MRVRNQYRLDLAVGDCLEKRQRILAGVFRMHAGIKHDPMPAHLKIVRISADLRALGQINEFQGKLKVEGSNVEGLKRRSGHMQEQTRASAHSTRLMGVPHYLSSGCLCASTLQGFNRSTFLRKYAASFRAESFLCQCR